MSVRTLSALLACLAFGLGGCGNAPTARWAVPDPGTTASATAAASPTRPAVDRSALQEKAKTATIAPKGMAAIGVSVGPRFDRAVDQDLTGACGKRVDADANDIHVGYTRVWSDQGWWVNNTAHAYGTATGAEVVGQARAAVESCKTYAASDGEHTLIGAVQLPRYPGVEASYGYCRSSKSSTLPTHVTCLAFLAKGNLVSVLWVIRGTTQQTNSSALVQVGSVAAQSLGKAS